MRIINEERPHISYSQLSTYLQCPLQYYFQYVQCIPWNYTPSAVVFGSSIHNAVEYYHRSLMNGHTASLDDVVGKFTSDWGSQIEANSIKWRKPEEPAELLTKGIELMELYHNEYGELAPEAVELEFRLPILDTTTGLFIESHDVVGKIDAIIGDGNIMEIKTASRASNQAEIDNNLQLTLYSWAYRMLYGAKEDKVSVVNLIKTKEPRVEVVQTKRNANDYIRLIMLLDRVITCIQNEMFYPNPIGGYGCSNCQYRTECADWGS